MTLLELTKRIQSAGIKGKQSTVMETVKQWLQANSLEIDQVDSETVDKIVKDLKGAIVPKAPSNISNRFSLSPQDYSQSQDQAAESLKLFNGVQDEAKIVINALRDQASGMSQEIGNEMLNIYNSITPNGIQHFAESLQNMNQNNFYGDRAEFFRQQIEFAFSNSNQSVDHSTDD